MTGGRFPIIKLSTWVPISRELIDPAPASIEDIAQWRTEAGARRAREDARHVQMLAAGGVVTAVAGLHAPDGRRECGGCDFTGADGEPPSWPCRTWELLGEQVPR